MKRKRELTSRVSQQQWKLSKVEIEEELRGLQQRRKWHLTSAMSTEIAPRKCNNGGNGTQMEQQMVKIMKDGDQWRKGESEFCSSVAIGSFCKIL